MARVFLPQHDTPGTFAGGPQGKRNKSYAKEWLTSHKAFPRTFDGKVPREFWRKSAEALKLQMSSNCSSGVHFRGDFPVETRLTVRFIPFSLRTPGTPLICSGRQRLCMPSTVIRTISSSSSCPPGLGAHQSERRLPLARAFQGQRREITPAQTESECLSYTFFPFPSGPHC